MGLFSEDIVILGVNGDSLCCQITGAICKKCMFRPVLFLADVSLKEN